MSELHEFDTEEKNAAMADLAADIEAAKKAELKPCPFCGKPGYKKVESDHHGTFFSLGCSDKLCPAHLLFYTADIEDLPKAVRFWNWPTHSPVKRGEPNQTAASVAADLRQYADSQTAKPGEVPCRRMADALDANQNDVRELAAAYDDFIKLLGEELAGLVGLAAAHGWESTKYEQGVACRERIGKAKKTLGIATEKKE